MRFFDVPTVQRKPWGILALILDVIVPGTGTIVAGAKVGETGQIIKGIIQLLLFWTIIGWVWSIIDGIRIFTHSTVTPAATAAARETAPAGAHSDYKPQCAALTEDGQQCRNSARGVSRYCASHKGYQPPTAKGLAQRIEGESWDADDKRTDRKSVASADTRPVVRKADDTHLKVRKAPKKAGKSAKSKK